MGCEWMRMSRLLYGLRTLAVSFLAVCWTVPVLAQEDELETIQIRPNVYAIFGAGGNITVHVGEDGVILVDSGSADMADRVLEAVEAITDQPIRMIINTSADADHVGGNQALAVTGVPIAGDAFAVAPTAAIVAHENVLLRMAGEGELPYEDWPTETYTAKLRSMYINADGVVLMRQTRRPHKRRQHRALSGAPTSSRPGDVLDLPAVSCHRSREGR